MTPRKELFIKTKQALMQIPEMELVDLERGQMTNEKSPGLFLAVLIRINKISWETMTEQTQEGDCSIDVTLYCRDGWLNQFNGSEDLEHGMNEIDLMDAIAEKLQFLKGNQFTQLLQTADETEDQNMAGIFSYRQTFTTSLYRKLSPKYEFKKVTI